MTRIRVALLAVLGMFTALLVALPGTLGTAAAATTTEVYFEKSGAYHQSRFDALAPAGYRMTSLSVYGPTSNPLYAATWLKTTGPGWSATHGISKATWDSQVSTQASNGLYPSIVTATGSSATAVFAGVFEQFTGSGNKPASKNALSITSFRNWNDYYENHGYSLRWADLYGTSSSPLVIAAWWPRTTAASKLVRESNSIDATAWDGTLELTPSGSVQAQIDAMYKAGMRIDAVGDNGSGQRLLMWRDDFPVGGFISYIGMTPADYQAKINDLSAHGGWFPIHVDVGGSTASGASINALWVTTPSIATRKFSSTSKGGVAMPAFDDYMKKLMTSAGAREANLAITRAGKLIYARGYGLTETGGAVAQPDTAMRVASCSKPIASIALQTLVEGGLSRSTKVYPYIYSGTTQATNKTVTLDELLYHAGGQVAGPSGDDAVFDDFRIASDLGLSLPINKYDVMHRMASLSPDYTPGTATSYSNYGYSLIGQAIEKRTGQTYFNALKSKVLTPLGITKMKIASTQTPVGEPTYEPMTDRVEPTWNSVYLAKSAFSSSATAALKTFPYGGWNIDKGDSYGAVVASSVDLARIMGAFDATNNPIFTNDSTSRTALWTRPNVRTYPSLADSGYDNTYRGFFRVDASGPSGTTWKMIGHNGSLAGTACLTFHRDDGLTFSMVMNRDIRGHLLMETQGRDLSAIADTISTWPTTDLFPTFGMASFS